MPMMQPPSLLSNALKKLRKLPKKHSKALPTKTVKAKCNTEHQSTPITPQRGLHEKQRSLKETLSSPALTPTANESPEASPQSESSKSSSSTLFWQQCESPTRAIRAVPPRRLPSFNPPPFFDECSNGLSFDEAELSQEIFQDKEGTSTIHPSCTLPSADLRRRRITFADCIQIKEIPHVVELMLEEDGTPPSSAIVTELKSQLWFQPCEFEAIRKRAYDLVDLVDRKGGNVQSFATSRKPYIRGLESLLHHNAVERHKLQHTLLVAVMNEQYHQCTQYGRIIDTVAVADCSLHVSQPSIIEAQIIAQSDANAIKPIRKRTTQK